MYLRNMKKFQKSTFHKNPYDRMTKNSLSTARDGKSSKNKNNNIYSNNMKKKDLEKLTKSQLIEMLTKKKPKKTKTI